MIDHYVVSPRSSTTLSSYDFGEQTAGGAVFDPAGASGYRSTDMNAGDRWPSFRSMVEHLELFALVSVACAALVLAFWFERERLVLRTEVMTVGPKTSLASIRGVIPLIVQQPILPVVGPDGLCGIVDLTGLDVCSDRETAAEVMGPPIMVDSRTSPHVVRGLMRRYTLPALPVVAEDGRVVGMFTLERHPARL